MNLIDFPRNPTSRVLRQFAAAWLVILSAVGAQQYFLKHHPVAGLVIFGVAIVAGVIGLIKPGTIRWLFIGASAVAYPIGWVVSQLVVAIMFYLLITPLAIVFRLCGRDVLLRKSALNRTSFWLPKKTPEDVRSYFRQY